MTVQIDPVYLSLGIFAFLLGYFLRRAWLRLLAEAVVIKADICEINDNLASLREIGKSVHQLLVNDKMSASVEKLAVSLGTFADLPAYTDGIRKVCVDMVRQSVATQKAITKFHEAVLGADAISTGPAPAFMEANEDRAYAEGEIRALEAEGVPRGEAEDRVKGTMEELSKQRSI